MNSESVNFFGEVNLYKQPVHKTHLTLLTVKSNTYKLVKIKK